VCRGQRVLGGLYVSTFHPVPGRRECGFAVFQESSMGGLEACCRHAPGSSVQFVVPSSCGALCVYDAMDEKGY
jgi:hypothetical protein